jgi:NAD(P)H-dependent flavin oxidoreductase YrpB (nitropropane dioxygenase family)
VLWPHHSLLSAIHPKIKETMVKSTEQDTVHIFRTLRNTARVFKNKVSLEVVALERRPGGAKFEDLRDLVSGQRGRLVYENGDKDYGIWSAGIALGLINDIPSCEELLKKMEVITWFLHLNLSLIGILQHDAEQIIEDIGKLRVKSKL